MSKHSLEGLDYFKLIKASKKLGPAPAGKELRLALLGDCATQQLAVLLRVLFHQSGINARIYEAGFDTIDLEVQNPASELYRFEPHAVVLLNALGPLKRKYFASLDPKSSFVAETVERFRGIWDVLAQRTDALIVQSNFVEPYERVFGNFDHKVSGSLLDAVQAINRRISEDSRLYPNVFINDVDYLASYVGRKHWLDEKLWALAKSPCALEHLPLLAQNVVDIVLASRGVGVKCVVLDLDNTLWGGIIGDDGVEGIRVGHLGEGEAYVAFQQYMLELSKRGILLAVSSKNTREAALSPFQRHPEMVLREKDFVMFLANWDNKADNITLIKETLNIGYDAMVFIDDNPFERNLVRQMLPQVIVPEMPEDPADYVKTLSELNLFETNAVSEVDKNRTDLYRQAADREMSKTKFSDIDDYLRSLEMKITLSRFDRDSLPRIAQLIQRSNQFNLATRRYNAAQCESFMNDEAGALPIYLSLGDKFGDYGIISVIVARIVAPQLIVDEYLMSCRVLQRGVEQYAMNWLVQHAKSRALTEITGTYRPSPKNAMVKDFFAQFGFKKIDEDEEGASWSLDVATYEPRQVHMTSSPGDAAAGGNLDASH
jgi:FkbH-like protein